jgi:hypothetical protein
LELRGSGVSERREAPVSETPLSASMRSSILFMPGVHSRGRLATLGRVSRGRLHSDGREC